MTNNKNIIEVLFKHLDCDDCPINDKCSCRYADCKEELGKYLFGAKEATDKHEKATCETPEKPCEKEKDESVDEFIDHLIASLMMEEALHPEPNLTPPKHENCLCGYPHPAYIGDITLRFGMLTVTGAPKDVAEFFKLAGDSFVS